MAASVLENIRTAHEEIEVLEKAVATCLDNKPKAHYGGLLTEAKASAYLCRIQHLSNRLLHLYEDADATKRVEAAALAGADHMALFYERLADVRGTGSSSRAGDAAAIHGAAAAGPSADPAAVVGPLDARVESEVASWFSAAEMYGRYVDMEAGAFDSWSALPGVKEARSAAAAASRGSAAGVAAAAADAATPFAGLLNSSDGQRNGGAGGIAAGSLPAGAATVDYSAFLARFVELHVALPPRVKASRQYRRHVAAAAQYLLDFFCRSRPLVDVADDLLAPLADEFVAAWGPALRGTGALPPGWGLAAHAADSSGAREETASGGSAEQAASSSGSGAASASLVDLATFASASQLAAQLSPEQLRQQLVGRGLKAGGTPQERAQRLWQVRGLSPQQYPRKLLAAPAAGAAAPAAPVGSEAVPSRGMEIEGEAGHASAAAMPEAATAGKGNNGGSSASSRDEGSTAVPALSATSFFSNRVLPALTASNGSGSSADAAPVPALSVPAHTVQQVLQPAWCEALLARFAGAYLADTLTASRKRADRRATRTAEEWAAEVEAEETEVLQGSGRATAAAAAAGAPAYEAPLTASGVVLDAADDDEDEEGATQYAANVVLGEDGKPIPYWLYKLHGLNIEYTCEICGGAGYRGRRAFDRHFQEWRHAYGMRCLGIPNTKHFHDITRIADALGLWEKLRGEGGREAFRPEAEAEFEDSAGNVLDRRTYEDLARQGLL